VSRASGRKGPRVKPEGDNRKRPQKNGGIQPARSVLCFPTDRAAYGRLSQLISQGQRRAEKGGCELGLDDLLDHAKGQIVVALPPAVLDDGFPTFLRTLSCQLVIWPRSICIAATTRRGSRPWPGSPPPAGRPWSRPATCSTTSRSGGRCKTC
jgi:hypothetical protein